MYVGSNRLSNLKSYLWGAAYVLSDLNIAVDGPDFSEFEAWLVKKFKFSGRAAGWANMITALSLGYDPKSRIDWENYDKNMSEEEHSKSVEMFFSLLEDYKASKQ